MYDGELNHQHTGLENEVTNTRRDLHGTNTRLVEVDNELGTVRADLTTTRHALVELDDMLTELRAEHAAFKRHAAANLASLNELAAELTAEVASLAGKNEDGGFVAMTVGVLRALTWNLGFQFRGERAPLDWDPDTEYARLAGETEADKPAPAPVATPLQCDGDGSDPDTGCPGLVVWRWWPNGRLGLGLCDEHAKDKHLSDLEDLASPADPS